MKRTLLTIILAIIALLLLGTVAAGIFFSTLDLNAYKDEVAKKIAEKTGKTVVFQGDISHSLFPLGLKTGRVIVQDEDIFGAEPFLAIESITLKADIKALLHREIRVEEAIVEGLFFKPAISTTGQKNWEFSRYKKNEAEHSSRALHDEEPTHSTESQKPSRFTWSLHSVKADGGKISYRDLQSGTLLDIALTSFSLGGLAPESEISLSLVGHATMNGKGSDILLEVAGEPFEEDVYRANLTRFSLQKNDRAFPDITASASLLYDSLQKSLSINDLKGSLDATELSGTFAVILPEGQNLSEGNEYEVRGEVHLGSVDIDALRAAFSGTNENLAQPTATSAVANFDATNQTNEAQAAKTQRSNKRGSDSLPLGKAYVSIAINAQSVSTQDITITNVSALPVLEKGVLRMPVEFYIYDGSAHATTEVRLQERNTPWNMALQWSDIKAEKLPVKAAREGKISGPIHGKAFLNGKGISKDEALASLTGRVAATLVNGQVKNFDVIPEEIATQHSFPRAFAINKASLSAQIKNGIATSKDISLASPLLTGKGSGTVDFIKNQVSIDMDFLAQRPPAVPVRIRGPFANVQYSIDMEKFVVNAAKAGLESGDGKKLLKKLPSGVGDVLHDEKLLKKLFKK